MSMSMSKQLVHILVRVCVRVRVCVCVRVCVHVHVHVLYKCWNAGLSGIQSVWYRNGKTNDARTDPVPDQPDAVQHFLVQYRT
jgi:hypothetical protein